MTDLEQILPLWRALEASREDYVLATVVAVEGSSYRKPGACMLLARDGRRAGTVSGGCLEAAVSRKAWWLTEKGPALERYSTLDDDGDLPYGSGCGGVIWILLERPATARALLQAMDTCFAARASLSVATVIEGSAIGTRAFASSAEVIDATTDELAPKLNIAVQESLRCASSLDTHVEKDGQKHRVWVKHHAARPALWIFGAGDDAKPLANFARELGWFVGVLDGRSHLATSTRFPQADTVDTLAMVDVRSAAVAEVRFGSADAAVLVTHSFEQDSRVLAGLIRSGDLFRIGYVGVLGPQRRTREVLAEAAKLLGMREDAAQIEWWLEHLCAPTGLDLGGEAPASVALSIIAEVQKAFTRSSGLPLREVRAVPVPVLS